MQQLRPDERREFQRLTLNPHIAGTLGKIPVSILEIGVLGARVQHSDALDSEYPELHFSHGGNDLAIKCEVVRTSGVKQSGLRFLAAIWESGDPQRDMLGIQHTKNNDHLRTPPG